MIELNDDELTKVAGSGVSIREITISKHFDKASSPSRLPPPQDFCVPAELDPSQSTKRSATRPQNGESECSLQDHDDLFSLSQHWRSASRLALPPLLRPGQCTHLVSPWCGHTRKSMRRIACLRRAPLGRNRRAMLMIRSLPSGWDNNGRRLQ